MIFDQIFAVSEHSFVFSKTKKAKWYEMWFASKCNTEKQHQKCVNRKLKPVYSYIKQQTHLCRQWLHFRILMRKIRLETMLAETSFPSTTWTLKRWALEENREATSLSSRHKYDPQAHKHRVAKFNAMVLDIFTTLTHLMCAGRSFSFF